MTSPFRRFSADRIADSPAEVPRFRPISWLSPLFATVMAFTVLGAGCDGIIQAGPDGPTPGVGSPPGSPGAHTGPGPSLAEAPPVATTRFARLTHAQWTHTVADLFDLEDASAFVSGFRSDPVQGGFLFDNNVLSLEVDQALWSAYQRAAIEIASHITSEDSRLQKIVPPEGGDSADRARRFIADFGARAHRRPLTDDEVDEYLAIFDAAPSLYTGLDPFVAGVRLVLEAMLQSPFFLYRAELSTEPLGGAIPLDGYEVAQRLSYGLWNTMPDDELFEAAATGALTRGDQVALQAERMLDDPRAEDVIAAFHRQLFGIGGYTEIHPSPAFFPDVSSRVGEYAVEEAERFVLDTLVHRQGGYRDFLTSTTTFVNAELAGLYGLSGSYGDEFVPAVLDASERRGFLTQIGFLGKNATSVDPDPIHRGIFIAERIACLHIAAPPDDIPALPAAGEGETNREVIEDLTEAPGSVCASCHSVLINPFGFPFEMYDAVGQYRTEDRGFPVNTAAAPLVDGVITPVGDALEYIEAIAVSPGVHQCYAQHWIEYAYGRPSVPEDRAMIERLGAGSVEGGSLRELIVGLVSAQAFLNRSLEELL